MTTNANNTLERIAKVLRTTFHLPSSYSVTETTTSADVDGWDSLSHATLMMAVEEEFQLEVPLDEAYELADVGALATLIDRLLPAPGRS